PKGDRFERAFARSSPSPISRRAPTHSLRRRVRTRSSRKKLIWQASPKGHLDDCRARFLAIEWLPLVGSRRIWDAGGYRRIPEGIPGPAGDRTAPRRVFG